MASPVVVKRIVAVIFTVSLVAVVVASVTAFLGGFSDTERVTVVSERAGLVMEPQAKVTMRGVEVGRVAAVRYEADHAVIDLDMNPSGLEQIPGNATVDIRSTTVFGAKYVNFEPPPDSSSEHLQPGTTVTADSVTVEFNTLFENLADVLQRVEPDKLNETLGAIATAVRGRGEEIGELIGDTDALLGELNPSLPALQRDLRAASGVTNLYADTAPDLLTIVDNVTSTGRFVTARANGLERLLLDVVGFGDNATAVLRENQQDLTGAVDLLRPTAELLDEYAPAINCLVVGLDLLRPKAEAVEGGLSPGFALSVSATSGVEPYTYPESLPRVNASGGPNCVGLPGDLDFTVDHPPFVVTDNAPVPYAPRTTSVTNPRKFFEVFFDGLYPGVGK
ncbi:MCE family protein [Rhodococcus gannanensis]|uniref:MCE family protein n=1 Tax=Rhodococcus gannanensis TaxID=1960308 RepID=A0ABW4P563_9NOCA